MDNIISQNNSGKDNHNSISSGGLWLIDWHWFKPSTIIIPLSFQAFNDLTQAGLCIVQVTKKTVVGLSLDTVYLTTVTITEYIVDEWLHLVMLQYLV